MISDQLSRHSIAILQVCQSRSNTDSVWTLAKYQALALLDYERLWTGNIIALQVCESCVAAGINL